MKKDRKSIFPVWKIVNRQYIKVLLINLNLFFHRQRNWLHELSSPRWWCSFNSQTWHWNTGYKNKNWFSSFWWQWMAPHFGFTGILKGKFWIIFLLFFFFLKKKKNFFHWNDFFPLFSCFYSMLNKHIMKIQFWKKAGVVVQKYILGT